MSRFSIETYKCDACGKNDEETPADWLFVELAISGSFKGTGSGDRDVCSRACCAALLRGIADKIDKR
jgi:hypothetical protein